MKKKKLFFYGNCHCAAIAEWIHANYPDRFELFDSEDCGVDKQHGGKNFAVWQLDLESQRLHSKCIFDKIKEADFFIFQPIENSVIRELQTEYLIDNVVTGTSVCIPNTRFYSYPLCEVSLFDHVKYVYKNISKNKKEIIHYLYREDDPKFREILFSKYESCMAENKRRYGIQANNCKNKIDMCEFIEKNWKTHLLFGTHNHPIGIYWKELISKLFNYLDEELDLEIVEKLYYPNINQIINPMEFLYFKKTFPDLIIPSRIEKLVGIEEVETPEFKFRKLVREPLSEYYE